MEYYSEGSTSKNGEVVLCNGHPLTINEIVELLNTLTKIKYEYVDIVIKIERLHKTIKEV